MCWSEHIFVQNSLCLYTECFTYCIPVESTTSCCSFWPVFLLPQLQTLCVVTGPGEGAAPNATVMLMLQRLYGSPDVHLMAWYLSHGCDRLCRGHTLGGSRWESDGKLCVCMLLEKSKVFVNTSIIFWVLRYI